ncbi:C39 family peptidase [Dictyobacter formicarum]|nr:C39 family peptidase [Dictyobacter formicarum]
MIIVLLMLLAIALTLVVAGLFLSPRSSAVEQQREASSYASREAARARMNRRGTSGQAYGRAASMRKVQKPARTQRVTRLQQPRVQMNYGAYEIVEPVAPVAGGWTQILALFNVKQLIQPRRGEATPWLGICLILIALFGAGMIALQPLLFAPSSTVPSFWTVITSDLPAPAAPKTVSKPANNPSQPLFVGVVGASKALVRLNQMSVDQYQSQSEFDRWAASACSAASMTEVINAYSGNHFRVTDILKVESNLHQITPEQGLLQSSGIDITVDRFGFNAVHLNNPSLDEVVKIANQGRPVIVSFPPSRVPGGHILVLRGGQGDQVYLADSSILNQTTMSRTKFLSLWDGFAVVVTPKK